MTSAMKRTIKKKDEEIKKSIKLPTEKMYLYEALNFIKSGQATVFFLSPGSNYYRFLEPNNKNSIIRFDDVLVKKCKKELGAEFLFKNPDRCERLYLEHVISTSTLVGRSWLVK